MPKSTLLEDLRLAWQPLLDCCELEIEAAWKLCALVLQVGELGIDSSNVADVVCAWHRQYNFTDDEIGGAEETFANGPIDDSVAFQQALFTIERLALCRDLQTCSRLIVAATDRLRGLGMSAEMENLISDVVALLQRRDSSPDGHAQWQLDANTILTDGRFVFGSGKANEDGTSPLDLLKDCLMNLLLMVSGDSAHMLQVVQRQQLTLMWFVSGVCGIIHSAVRLTQIQDIIDFAEKPLPQKWLDRAAKPLFNIICAGDVARAVSELSWDSSPIGDLCLVALKAFAGEVCVGPNDDKNSICVRGATMDAFAILLTDSYGGRHADVALQSLAENPHGDPNILSAAMHTVGRQSFSKLQNFVTSHLSGSARVFVSVCNTWRIPTGTAELRSRFIEEQLSEVALATIQTLKDSSRFVEAVDLALRYQQTWCRGYLEDVLGGDGVLTSRAAAQIGQAVGSGLLFTDNTELISLLTVCAHLSDFISEENAVESRLHAARELLEPDDVAALNDGIVQQITSDVLELSGSNGDQSVILAAVGALGKLPTVPVDLRDRADQAISNLC